MRYQSRKGATTLCVLILYGTVSFLLPGLVTVYFYVSWPDRIQIRSRPQHSYMKIAHISPKDLEESFLPRVDWHIDTNRPIGEVCLRRWNMRMEHLVHMHIGKSGGTTLDNLLRELITLNGLTEHMRPSIKSYNDFKTLLNMPIRKDSFPIAFWFKHHDMYYVNEAEADGLSSKIAAIGFIRDPVDREVSQFNFAKKKKILRKNYTVAEWVRKLVESPDSVKGSSSLFADGSSGVMWFAGLGTEGWINPKGLSAEMYAANAQQLLSHPIEALKRAVRNFHRHFLWVGILEQFESSMDLFGFQTNLTLPKDVSRRRDNYNGLQERATVTERLALATAYPMDVAFYAYIKAVQTARLERFREAKARGDNGNSSNDLLFCKDRREWEASISYPFYFNGSTIWPS